MGFNLSTEDEILMEHHTEGLTKRRDRGDAREVFSSFLESRVEVVGLVSSRCWLLLESLYTDVVG
jgi:hypothetical protein